MSAGRKPIDDDDDASASKELRKYIHQRNAGFGSKVSDLSFRWVSLFVPAHVMFVFLICCHNLVYLTLFYGQRNVYSRTRREVTI